MRRWLAVICGLLCVLGSHFCAYAADSGEIVCGNISAKQGRLIYVDVCLKSQRDLAAGSFYLEYDSEKLEFRSVSTEVPGAEVKAKDSGGKIKAVFLCADGLILKNTPLVFSAEYKKLTDESSSVKISAEDCYDSRLNPVKDFSQTECKVFTSEVESVRSTTGRVYHKVKSPSALSKTKSKETSSASSNSVKNASLSSISSISSRNQKVEYERAEDTRPILLVLLFIGAMFITALFLAAVIKINNPGEKNR